MIERLVRLAIAAIKPVVDVQPSEPTASNKLELKKKKNYTTRRNDLFLRKHFFPSFKYNSLQKNNFSILFNFLRRN